MTSDLSTKRIILLALFLIVGQIASSETWRIEVSFTLDHGYWGDRAYVNPDPSMAVPLVSWVELRDDDTAQVGFSTGYRLGNTSGGSLTVPFAWTFVDVMSDSWSNITSELTLELPGWDDGLTLYLRPIDDGLYIFKYVTGLIDVESNPWKAPPEVLTSSWGTIVYRPLEDSESYRVFTGLFYLTEDE